MSNTIDERIVQMQFNNRQFESGVRESVSSLEKLKKGLQLDDATRSLSGLSSAGRNFNLGGIASGVETIASKFSVLGIMGVTALANITNAAINTGKHIVSALTIDPIKTGFNEYELKMNAIQTMMAGSGESLETVNKYLADLNTYSDQTIYSFSDMTQNIGKFTNAGVKLDDAVNAIKGISNEAALSGANANEAARAMYNLSQAMSMGYVQLIDWKSIEMANMGTVDFKNNLLATAIAEGTVKKNSKGLYVTPDGNALNAMGMFKDGLQDQWLTSEVLLKTLNKYSDTSTELGRRATKAATEIKTLSQMYGVLKESAQSGWAQTWEIISGNFDEGKAIFTELNDFIGGFISESAKARNEMLQFWKDKGGREDGIDAFKNLARFAGETIGPIREVAKEFFPPMTGERLVALTKSFKEFTEKLKIGATGIAKIKSIASGFFASLSIGIQFIKALVKGIIDFIKWLKPAGKGLTDLWAKFGDWLKRLDSSIKKGDTFNKAFAKMKKIIVDVADAVKRSFDKIITSVEDFSGVDFTSFETFTTTLKQKLQPLTKVGEFVDKSVTWIGNLFKKMGPFFGKIGKGIGDFISRMNLSSIVQLFETGVLATIIVGIQKLIKSLTSITDGAGGFLKGITDILDGVKGCLSAWQQELKANILMKIAGAILILAVALLVMSGIDTNKLAGSLTAITVLFTELFASMSIFEKIAGSKGFTAMGRVTRAMILLSVAVLILAKAVEVLAGVDWDGLAIGMVGVTGLIGLLIGTAKLMSKVSGDLIKSSIGFILFTVSIRILVESVEALAGLSFDALAKGIGGVLLLCGMLVGMMAASKLGSISPKDGFGLLILAVAIRILASAVSAFGNMDPDKMMQGLWALTIVLGELAVFIWLVDEKQMAAMGAGLLLLAASMVIFAYAVKKIGELPFEVIAKGIIGLAGALGAVILAVRLMPPNMVQIGVGMLAISIGLVLIAKAMQMIGGMSPEQIVKGLVGLGLALTILVIAINSIQGALAGAAALVICTIALLGLAVVMKMIGGMPIDAIGKALLAIFAVLVILGGAAAILTPILPSMLILGAALIVLGLGLAAVGAAALILSIGLGALSVAGLAGVGILLAIGAAMLPLVLLTPAILAVGAALLVLSIGVLATGFALSILGAGLAVIVALGEPGMAALVLLASTAVQISQFALELVAAGVGLVLFGAGAVLAGAGAILAGLGIFVLAWGLKALAKVDMTQFGGLLQFSTDLLASSLLLLLAAPGLLAAGAALVVFGAGATSTGEGIVTITVGLLELTKTVSTVPGMIESATNIITAALDKMINNMVSTLTRRKEDVKTQFGKIVEESADRINDKKYLFYTCGVNLVDGFIAGIKSRANAAMEEAATMAINALQAANKALDINSPSGKFELVGEYANKGLAKGLSKYAKLSTNAAADMAESTIRPVMSMTQARSSSVNFGSRQTANVSALASEVQNRGYQQQANEAQEVVNPTTELTGVLTVQVKNDKGEIIGIAQTAVKDLLRRESR